MDRDEDVVRVFLSYSHRDGVAGRLTALVKRAIDECNGSESSAQLVLFADTSDILPGDQWRQVIDDALHDTDIFLPCISPDYCLSGECAYEFNGFEKVRRATDDGRCCVPLFWESVSSEYLKIDSFHNEVFERAQALNGVDASALVARRTSKQQLAEELLVSDLADALLRATQHIVELRSSCESSLNPEEFVLTGSRRRDVVDVSTRVPFVALNMMCGGAEWPDEREFMRIKDVTDEADLNAAAFSDGFTREVPAVEGHRYLVKMLIHNCSPEDAGLIARSVSVGWDVPRNSAGRASVQGTVSAVNIGETSKKNEKNEKNAGALGDIWDEVGLTCGLNQTIELTIVDGSARYYALTGRGSDGGHPLNKYLGGLDLLIESEDGSSNLPGGISHAGIVTLLVQVKRLTAAFTTGLRLRKKGESLWSTKAVVRPNESCEVRIDYLNKGLDNQMNVIVKVLLPAGVTYLSRSAQLRNADHRDGLYINNDDWWERGMVIGSYAPDSNAIIEFSVCVPELPADVSRQIYEIQALCYTKDGTKFSNCHIVVENS